MPRFTLPGSRPTARLVAAIALAGPLPAAAQVGEGGSSLVVYAGQRGGSGFQAANAPNEALHLRSSVAATLAFERPYDETRHWQFLASHQRTRLVLSASAAAPGAPRELPLDVSHFHAGGVNYFDGPAGRGPYVAGGLGLSHLSPNLPGTEGRWRWSMNLALGYEWALARQLSLRLEARGYAIAVRSQGGFFCSGGCTVFIQSETLYQGEAAAGLRLRF